MSKIRSLLLVTGLMVFLQACGSGGGASVSPQVQKTAIVEFATSTTDTSTRLWGVYIEATLPDGVTVATKPGTSEISSGALQGVDNTGQVLFSTYSASIRKIKIPVVSVSNADITIGTFAKLTCTVLPGYTLTASQFSSIVPIVFEPTGLNGVDLTIASPPVISKISATFGYY